MSQELIHLQGIKEEAKNQMKDYGTQHILVKPTCVYLDLVLIRFLLNISI